MTRDLPATSLWGETWRIAVAALVGAAIFVAMYAVSDGRGDIGWFGDAGLGVLSLGLVLFRRRYPLLIALILTLLSAFVTSASGAVLVVLVSLGTRRKWRECLIVLPVWMSSGVLFAFLYPGDNGPEFISSLVTQALLFAACIGVGAAIGSQRAAMAALQARAESAEAEQSSRIARAQASERTRIAHEMHDVLAHRISLIAMHSGALAYRTDLPREQIQQTAELLRDNADRAVSELREVLGVLRAEGEAEQSRAPQPDLSGLDHLVEEGSALGAPVSMNIELSQPYSLADVPRTTSRTTYRVVQEALTNARKHAPGAPVTVAIEGAPGVGLSFVIRNPPVNYGGPTRPPESSGMGLVGLTERVSLSGGVMSYGIDRAGDFVVHGRLSWDGQA